jgi:hypothetical protein
MAATGIVIPFERAEAAVSRWRRAYTTDGAEGMPAHVTLIYPFVDDAQLVAGDVSQLRAVLSVFSPFDVCFATFGRFAGPSPVLYLEPDPAGPFAEIIDAIAERFPEHPPFGGEFDTVVPHLTVVETDNMEVLRDAEQDVTQHLPIATRATEVHLMEHRGEDGWCIGDCITL